jgi:hypothetical protein
VLHNQFVFASVFLRLYRPQRRLHAGQNVNQVAFLLANKQYGVSIDVKKLSFVTIGVIKILEQTMVVQETRSLL